MLLGAFGCFLPWASGVDGADAGIDLADGTLVLVATAVAYLLGLRRVRWAWIPAGFAAAIAIRDLVLIQSSNDVTVGFGLWLTAGTVAVATILLFRDLVLGTRPEA